LPVVAVNFSYVVNRDGSGEHEVSCLTADPPLFAGGVCDPGPRSGQLVPPSTGGGALPQPSSRHWPRCPRCWRWTIPRRSGASPRWTCRWRSPVAATRKPFAAGTWSPSTRPRARMPVCWKSSARWWNSCSAGERGQSGNRL